MNCKFLEGSNSLRIFSSKLLFISLLKKLNPDLDNNSYEIIGIQGRRFIIAKFYYLSYSPKKKPLKMAFHQL